MKTKITTQKTIIFRQPKRTFKMKWYFIWLWNEITMIRRNAFTNGPKNTFFFRIIWFPYLFCYPWKLNGNENEGKRHNGKTEKPTKLLLHFHSFHYCFLFIQFSVHPSDLHWINCISSHRLSKWKSTSKSFRHFLSLFTPFEYPPFFFHYSIVLSSFLLSFTLFYSFRFLLLLVALVWHSKCFFIVVFIYFFPILVLVIRPC